MHPPDQIIKRPASPITDLAIQMHESYRQSMKEYSDEVKELQQLVAALIHANGGQIIVSDSQMKLARSNSQITSTYDKDNRRWIFSTFQGYGKCPHCAAKVMFRERRPNGNDTCENGHIYPSSASVK